MVYGANGLYLFSYLISSLFGNKKSAGLSETIQLRLVHQRWYNLMWWCNYSMLTQIMQRMEGSDWSAGGLVLQARFHRDLSGPQKKYKYRREGKGRRCWSGDIQYLIAARMICFSDDIHFGRVRVLVWCGIIKPVVKSINFAIAIILKIILVQKSYTALKSCTFSVVNH